MLYYIIFHLIFTLLLIYNLFKIGNGKVKLERSRLWQLDNSKRKSCERGWYWEVATLSKDFFPLIYIFFDVKERWNKKLLGRLYFISFWCMYVCTYKYLFITYIYFNCYTCISIYYIYIHTTLSIYLSVCLSVCLSVYLSIYICILAS